MTIRKTTAAFLKPLLPDRARAAHKGVYGHVLDRAAQAGDVDKAGLRIVTDPAEAQRQRQTLESIAGVPVN